MAGPSFDLFRLRSAPCSEVAMGLASKEKARGQFSVFIFPQAPAIALQLEIRSLLRSGRRTVFELLIQPLRPGCALTSVSISEKGGSTPV